LRISRAGEGSGPAFPPGANSAFACILPLDCVRVAGDTALAAAIETVDDFSLACAGVAEHWLASCAVLALGGASWLGLCGIHGGVARVEDFDQRGARARHAGTLVHVALVSGGGENNGYHRDAPCDEASRGIGGRICRHAT
jgi:hypothetical protein